MTRKICVYRTWVRNFTLSFGEGRGEVPCSIGGGQGNTVAAGTKHSGIFSGFGNTVSGSCSVVLGGLNNSDGGFPNTAVFGNTLVASVDPATMGVPSAFWVDELVAINIPDVASYLSLPAGAIYSITRGTGPGSKQLFVV